MQVTLIRPRPDPESIGLMHLMICEPLELEYLSAYLKEHGHQVRVIDMIIERQNVEDLVQEAAPDLVGITSYITNIGIVKDYARKIKIRLPKVPIIIGGLHAEVCPEDFEDAYVDYIAYIDGLSTIGALVDNLESRIGREENIREINGLWAGQGMKDYKTVPNFTLLRPDRTCTAQYRRHYNYLFHTPCALLKSSFGCAYKCDFCFCWQITKGKYFERPIDDVVEEIAEIKEPNVFIVDDNFLFSEERIINFCSLIEKRGIRKKFILFGRADFIASHPALIRRLSQIGLEAIFIGIESFKDDDLEQYHKKCTVAVNETAARILRDCGVDAYSGVVVGQDWSVRDFANLTAWLNKHHLDLANIQPLTPLPGTPYYERFKNDLVVSRSEYGKWDLTHLVLRPTKLTPRQFYWQLICAYFRTTISIKNTCYVLHKYGLKVALRICWGIMRITAQYLKLWVRAT